MTILDHQAARRHLDGADDLTQQQIIAATEALIDAILTAAATRPTQTREVLGLLRRLFQSPYFVDNP